MSKSDAVLAEVEKDLQALRDNGLDADSQWKDLGDTPLARQVFDLQAKAKEAERVILDEGVKQLHGLALLAQHFLPEGEKVDIPDIKDLMNG
jgi:hypothetical protein